MDIRDIPKSWPQGKPLPRDGIFFFYDPTTDAEYKVLPPQFAGGLTQRQYLTRKQASDKLTGLDPVQLTPGQPYQVYGEDWNGGGTTATVLLLGGADASSFELVGLLLDAQAQAKGLVEVAVAAGTFAPVVVAGKFATLTDDPLANLLLAAYLADKLSLSKPGLQVIAGPVELSGNGYPTRFDDGDWQLSDSTEFATHDANGNVTAGFNVRGNGRVSFISDTAQPIIDASDFECTTNGLDPSVSSFTKLARAFWGLVKGAPVALDTLKEIADQLAKDEQGAAAILATQQQHTQQLGDLSANSAKLNKNNAFAPGVALTFSDANGNYGGFAPGRSYISNGNGSYVTEPDGGIQYVVNTGSSASEIGVLRYSKSTGWAFGVAVQTFSNSTYYGLTISKAGVLDLTNFTQVKLPANSSSGYTDAQARAAQLNRTAPAGTMNVTLTSESPRDYGTAASSTFTVDATNAVVGAGAGFRLGTGASAPSFQNAPSDKPFVYVGVAYATGKAFGYSVLVQADAIEVVTYPL